MQELLGKNIVVFDFEIKKAFEAQGYSKFTEKEFKDMGISVGVLLDYRTADVMVCLSEKDLIAMAARLINADLAVGFNVDPFDVPLLWANIPEQRQAIKTYDMLRYSREACGWKEPMYYPKGLNLNEHLKGTFGPQAVKTEDAAQAPTFYQNGEMGRLISYCIADVYREARLFEHIWATGGVTTPTHGRKEFKTTPQYCLSLSGKSPIQNLKEAPLENTL